MQKKKLPVGIEDFEEIRTEGFYYNENVQEEIKRRANGQNQSYVNCQSFPAAEK